MSKEYALAFIRAILPETSELCRKLGMPIPTPIQESDIVMGGSAVAVSNGRVGAKLRLRCGHEVIFYAGHVGAIQARDVAYNHPWRHKYFKESREYRDPTTCSKEQAVLKVHQILVERLGLPPKGLFLDSDPVFLMTPDAAATNGMRRYVFQWQEPETAEQREERMRKKIMPEISVSAEVDAVSGEIKAITFVDKSFEKPDPKIDIPMRRETNAAGTEAPKEKPR